VTEQKNDRQKPTGLEFGLTVATAVGFYEILTPLFPAFAWAVYLGIAAIGLGSFKLWERSKKTGAGGDDAPKSRTGNRIELLVAMCFGIGTYQAFKHFFPGFMWAVSFLVVVVICWAGFNWWERSNKSEN